MQKKTQKAPQMRSMQRGIAAIGPLLAVVAIIGIVTVVVASSGSAKSPTTNSGPDRVRASAVVDQATLISNAFGDLVREGVAPGDVTYDTNATTGLFGSRTGADLPAVLPAGTSVGGWQVMWDSNAPIGRLVTTEGRYAGVTIAVTQPVCAAINNLLAGSTAVTVSGFAATEYADATADLGIGNGFAGRVGTCQESADGAYHYVHKVHRTGA